MKLNCFEHVTIQIRSDFAITLVLMNTNLTNNASEFLKAAIQAACAAEQIILDYYSQQVQVDYKQDESPVTIADVEAERAIRKILTQAFPDHGFYGEETGQASMDADYIWLIDPIDGTKSFIREYPFFSTQIALMHQGEIIVGVSNAPGFNELAYAERNGGAYFNNKLIRTSSINTIKQASLSSGNIASLAGSNQWQAYGQLLQQVNRTRGYGDFYHYHLLACGKIDVIVESDLNILDIAALSLIVTEAGGVFTELDGSSINLETRTVLAAANQVLYDQVMDQLKI